MQLLRNFAPWLLLAFLGQQVSLSAAKRGSLGSRLRSSSNPKKPKASGKFNITKDSMQCTWRAEDVREEVRLFVRCENPEARVKGGMTDLECKYYGKPELCPGYKNDPKPFWKQVGRTFKRLKSKVCLDGSALVKTGMCKRAPRDAHFKLDVSSSVASAQSGQPETKHPKPLPTGPSSPSAAGPTACTGREQQQKKAEESCGRWASVCTFFFTMMQSEDC